MIAWSVALAAAILALTVTNALWNGTHDGTPCNDVIINKKGSVFLESCAAVIPVWLTLTSFVGGAVLGYLLYRRVSGRSREGSVTSA